MSVIAIHSTALLTRRIRELQRRRQSLLMRQERLRNELPDWAVEPLRLVGLSVEEIRGMVNDLSEAEREIGLDENDRRLDELDREIEDLEDLLLSAPSNSLEGIEAVMNLGVARLREFVISDPSDVLYDHGEARLLALFERVLADLQDLLQRERLDAV